MKKNTAFKPLQNSSGFLVTEFLFAFVMIMGIGMFMFALSFSLATIEISQYIVWSAARNYTAAHMMHDDSLSTASKKFNNLSARFPLLTGAGSSGNSWFVLSKDDLLIGNLAVLDQEFGSQLSSEDILNMNRAPWFGVSTKLNLKLFAGLKIPFLGKVAENPSDFNLNIRTFLIRHPSVAECRNFIFSQRYTNGILKLENGKLAQRYINDFSSLTDQINLPSDGEIRGFGEDNGC